MGYRLLHWGPIITVCIIGTITTCAIMCLFQWWPITSIGGAIHFAFFMTWAVGTMYNFFNSAFIGPGYVPEKWEPKKDEDKKYLQFCMFCETYKCPRSHHCRKCDQCVLKMDHHCPWINNCVGHNNHAYFTYFLAFAPIGCIHAATILVISMYHAVYLTHYIAYGNGSEPMIFLSLNKFIACMFAVGLAIGVTVAVGGLLYIQIRGILKNETGIETWIIEKAAYRDREKDEGEFVYPYNLGTWNNLMFVFSWTRDPRANGIWWPVVDGCDQYTLTYEQVKQKKEKQDRSIVYVIHEKYSGSMFPCTKGYKVLCCPPCTDEARIAVDIGDNVRVSRWRKYWLYGDKILDEKARAKRVRGWFPRRCAKEPYCNDSTDVPASTNTPPPSPGVSNCNSPPDHPHTPTHHTTPTDIHTKKKQ